MKNLMKSLKLGYEMSYIVADLTASKLELPEEALVFSKFNEDIAGLNKAFIIERAFIDKMLQSIGIGSWGAQHRYESEYYLLMYSPSMSSYDDDLIGFFPVDGLSQEETNELIALFMLGR